MMLDENQIHQVEEKLKEFGEISASLAEKWQKKAEAKRALRNRKI